MKGMSSVGLPIIALIIINIFTVYKYIFRMVFIDMDDFNESLRYSFTPDILSLFRGRYWKDQFGEFKLGIFIISCISITGVEYMILSSIFQHFF